MPEPVEDPRATAEEATPQADASVGGGAGATPGAEAAPDAAVPESAAAAVPESTVAAVPEPTAAAAPEAEPEPVEPDARLLEAHDLALAALHEITPAASIGDPAGHRLEPDGVVSLLFANRLLGYGGWFWTVSLAVVDGAEPTVLEAELLPGGDALLAPEWVPWSVRLKEYQAQQRAQAEADAAEKAARAAAGGADDDGNDDADNSDGVSFDEFDAYEDEPYDSGDEYSSDGSPILHAGDVDGVDIDELDADADTDTDED